MLYVIFILKIIFFGVVVSLIQKFLWKLAGLENQPVRSFTAEEKQEELRTRILVLLWAVLAVLILASLFFLVLANTATATDDEIKQMARPCKADEECVLFADECRFLKAVLKSKLPEDHQSFGIEDKITIYTWNSSKRICMRNLLRHPDWSENPVARCIENICTVASKDSSPQNKKPSKQKKKSKQ